MLNVVEYILVFAGIPIAFVLLLAALIFLPGRKRTRYKPGQPWDHAPVWYEPHPEHGPAVGHGTPGHDGQTQAIGSSVYGEVQGGPAAGGPHLTADAGGSDGAHPGAGAHGNVSQGATAVSAGAPVRGQGGPLGGARGTW